MRCDALQAFENISSPTPSSLGELLAVFRTQHVKPQSLATVKHKFQISVFNPSNQKLVEILEELQLQRRAKNAFGLAAHAITDNFMYAKVPQHLKESVNQVHLKNSTYQLTVTQNERQLELIGLKDRDELQLMTVS